MVVVIATMLSPGVVGAQVRSKCPELDLVEYSDPRELISERVVLEPGTDMGGRFPALRRFEELQSPFGTAHALISYADTKQRGPWTTVVGIRGNEVRELDLLITFKDHGSGSVRPRWLNEKLIAFRVWWGRVIATELIVNVETAELLYFEEANYQHTLVACEEKERLLAEAALPPPETEESTTPPEIEESTPPTEPE